MANRVRERLEGGDTALCVTLDFPTPAAAEYLGGLGVDALAVDLERGFPDWGRLEDVARACAVVGVDLIARLPVDADLIGRCLDIGVDGLELTHVESADDISTLLRCVRYAPDGDRGLGRSRSSRFGSYPGGYQKLVASGGVPLIVIHIESRRGMEGLPAILRPEVDVVVIGAYDLSNDLGLAGEIDRPPVQDAVAAILDSVRRAGKVVGLSASTAAGAAHARARGARFVLAAQARLLSASLEQLDRAVHREGGAG